MLSNLANVFQRLLIAVSALTDIHGGEHSDGPKRGAVASEKKVCSEIGIKLMKDGGNAVDALVGTVFCVGTVAMYHSGIGGGGFVLLRMPDGTYESVNFREKAPAKAEKYMYDGNKQGSKIGGLASGVPGQLRGLEYIHKSYGALKWTDVIAPAKHLASDGFKVDQDLVKYMQSKHLDNTFLTADPTWAKVFAPHGDLVKKGDTIYRQDYATTLEAIANEGADAFYIGRIAKETIKALEATNGSMTMQDLKDYTITSTRNPASIRYRDYYLTSTTAPSSGFVALSALNILGGYDDFQEPSQSKLSTHRMIEAIKWAYAQRTKIGDPAFVASVAKYTKNMLLPETGAKIRSMIFDDTTFPVEYYDPEVTESLETPGTSQIVAADDSGLTVSMTTTIGLLFGSQVMVPQTGVIMNNEMNNFNIPSKKKRFGHISNKANFIKPGKRPLSAISPIIAETEDGQLLFSIGSAGGSRIITANIQNAIHLLDGGMTTLEALAKPRLHDQLVPPKVEFEREYNNDTIKFLKSLHHKCTQTLGRYMSAAQGLRQLPNGAFEAAGEPRQVNAGGCVLEDGQISCNH